MPAAEARDFADFAGTWPRFLHGFVSIALRPDAAPVWRETGTRAIAGREEYNRPIERECKGTVGVL